MNSRWRIAACRLDTCVPSRFTLPGRIRFPFWRRSRTAAPTFLPILPPLGNGQNRQSRQARTTGNRCICSSPLQRWQPSGSPAFIGRFTRGSRQKSMPRSQTLVMPCCLTCTCSWGRRLSMFALGTAPQTFQAFAQNVKRVWNRRILAAGGTQRHRTSPWL